MNLEQMKKEMEAMDAKSRKFDRWAKIGNFATFLLCVYVMKSDFDQGKYVWALWMAGVVGFSLSGILYSGLVSKLFAERAKMRKDVNEMYFAAQELKETFRKAMEDER